MQNILSLVQTTSSQPVATVSTEAMKSESGTSSFSESFFSMILGQYAQTEEKTTSSSTLPVTTQEEDTSDLSTTEGDSKSIDEHLLEDLLSVVSTLQQDPTATVFPTLNASSSLEKLVASETTRQEFANVKSVSDLMDLSQKYNLGLEKMSISTESAQSLQTKFPTLDQNNFFDDLQTALNTTKTDTSSTPTTSNVINFLDKQPTQNVTQTPSILSELISKDISTTETQTLSTQTDALSEEKPLIVNEKQQNAQAFQKETTEVTNKPLEVIVQKVASTNETKKAQTLVQTDATIDDEPVQTVTTTRINDIKVEDATAQQDESIDTVLKTIKTDKISDEASEDELIQTQKIVRHDEDDTKTTDSDDSQSTIDVKNDLKTTNIKQEVTTKTTTTTKESLNQFASDLQEKIEAYKPPIMKVELSLSPKSLGDVDVTLLTRGNNLHVNISSSATTMNLFTQNQDDVKSALINMGFTNLEMNFSDQSNKEQAQKQKNSSGNADELTTEQTGEETTLLEIVIPQYV